MIKITLNGEEHKLDKQISLQELVARFNLDPEKIVIQLNEEIIQRDKYKVHQINNEDKVELIKFMAGG